MTLPPLFKRSILTITPLYDTPGINSKTGRPWKDATGAFIPEAVQLIGAVGGHISSSITFDNHKPMKARKTEVLAQFDRLKNFKRTYDTVALFCHAWAGKTSGVQAGFYEADIDSLAQAIVGVLPVDRSEHDIYEVILYCCSAGNGEGIGGDDGFADRLRDRLCELGVLWVRVFAHTTAGHATQNSYVRVFEGTGVPHGAAGGQWLVAPGSALWKPWVKALKGPMRFEYPFLSNVEVHEQLARMK